MPLPVRDALAERGGPYFFFALFWTLKSMLLSSFVVSWSFRLLVGQFEWQRWRIYDGEQRELPQYREQSTQRYGAWHQDC
jgi:hypothetical protein